MNNLLKAHLALFMANLFYGINYVITKGVMPTYISPTALTFLRIMPSTLMFWLLCHFYYKEKVDKKDIPRLIVAGFLGVFINQLMFIKGLSYSSPIDAAIIMTTNPILVLILSAIFLKETITKTKATGVLLGAAGALILILGKGFKGFNADSITGDILLLLNSFSFALYLIVSKPLMEKYTATVVLKWAFLFGAIGFFPIGIMPFSATNWENITLPVSMSFIYIVFFTTFLTYLLINYSLKHVKSTTVSMYIYTQPVVAGIVATLIGMDKPSVINVTASFLVFAGVYMVSGVNKHVKAKINLNRNNGSQRRS
jgi:drug/metabolite transporter (DMT)-like permease